MNRFNDHGIGRRSKKVAGVCADLGQAFNIDPTFLRVGLAFFAVMVSWEMALLGYIAAGIWLHVEKRKLGRAGRHENRFGRRDGYRAPRASVHDLRHNLDANDRRMMAIDRHLSTPNDDLAREIEALREEVK